MNSSADRPKPARNGWFSGMSFRSRLSWSTVLIVAIAVAATTIYTFYRTGLTNTYLTGQITESVENQTEKELTFAAARHARDLDNFFTSASSSITTLGTSIQNLLKPYAMVNTSGSWDARNKLSRLPNGRWDNPNTEAGSIFVPAQEQLPDPLVAELNILKQIDFIAPSMLKENPDMIALFFGSMQGETLYYPNVDLAAILPPDFDVTERTWFLLASPSQNPDRKVVWAVPYQDAAQNGLVVTTSYPIYDDFNRFRGAIGADLQLAKISNQIGAIRFAQSGYAFLLDKDGRIIAMPEAGFADLGLSQADFQGELALEPILDKVPLDAFDIVIRMTTGQSGVLKLVMNGTEKYVAYQPIPSTGYSLGIVVPVSETQSTLVATREQLANESQRTLINVIVSAVALLAGALLISRWTGNTLAKPITQLTETATRLAEGDLSAEAHSQTRDEVGVLANAFNVMTTRLRDTIGSLEERVEERTLDLQQATAQSTKRAEELHVVSEVARAVSTEIDLEKLLELVTNVVSNRFGFYHVGVFLIDQVNKTAVLRASNSPGGKRMITRKHSLPIGQVGIVGHVAASGTPRIALDVGEDATFFNNPDLPETRSEMALPLTVRGQIIGVLDVQSTKPGAFTSADAETLSILADQVAIAIENARLLAETREALAESQALYGDYVSRTWEKKTAQSIVGYQYSAGTGSSLEKPVEWDEIKTVLNTGRAAVSDEKIPAVAVPIRLQNQVIGVLNVRSADTNRTWTRDEVAVIEAVADRLALALENARLFEETSSRAAREHAVAEITSRIRETNDPQVMIRTAIEELQRVLNVNRVEIIPQVVSAHLPGREREGQEAK
ncbi:MAG: GAF domain-containing protein [Chloroflexota bacterium]